MYSSARDPNKFDLICLSLRSDIFGIELCDMHHCNKAAQKLISTITAAADQVQNISAVFERVRQSMFQCFVIFVLKQKEEFFEHLL